MSIRADRRERLKRSDVTHKVKKVYRGNMVYYTMAADRKYDSEIDIALEDWCKIFEVV